MLGLIVVAFIAPHQLEYGNAARSKQAVGADDDQYDCYKEQQ